MLYVHIMNTDKKIVETKEDDSKDKMVKKILRKQLKTINPDIKLMFKDVKRICKHINGNIFNKKTCCLWMGKVTNNNNKEKGIYVNFFLNGKKRALHRLLYYNFIGNLAPDEYLTFKCKNKGICCTIHHLTKISKNNVISDPDDIKKKYDEDDDVIIERKKNKINNKLVLKFE